ncbi:MAG: hypothetical protein P4L43_11805 [Syntrophobacteraceae bacterium]|nr:hypothetical protein [Syntrophobacteraceae bacterium]
MRSLKDFSRKEWLRNKPLDHFLIEFLNDRLQRFFRALHPGLDRFLQDSAHLTGKNIGLVIAYEQPWALDWLLKTASSHLPDTTLLVFDNSRKKSARLAIEQVCRNRGALRLGLPPCPTKHPNRSHGMAMTWVYYNVVKKLRPKIFTYIDHDLIPIKKIEMGQVLGDQPFYGLPNVGRWGWSLWAGYCSFAFSAVCERPLNFLNDFSMGLDTGGRNWSCLYKNFDPAGLRLASLHRMAFRDPEDGVERSLDIVDDNWLHLGGASYREGFQSDMDLYARLAKATDEGASLATLIAERTGQADALPK